MDNEDVGWKGMNQSPVFNRVMHFRIPKKGG
jgi:hypothetical protein